MNNGMLLLADEAHGTHFYFGEISPALLWLSGADMASVSIHKTGGSLTQSAMLLCAEGINADYVRQVINLTQQRVPLTCSWFPWILRDEIWR